MKTMGGGSNLIAPRVPKSDADWCCGGRRREEDRLRAWKADAEGDVEKKAEALALRMEQVGVWALCGQRGCVRGGAPVS